MSDKHLNNDDEPIDSGFHPPRSIGLIVEYLAFLVNEELGTHNGQTALHWHLLDTVKKHAKGKNDGRDEIILRCNYILGMCNSEKEMKLEAKAILKLLGVKE